MAKRNIYIIQAGCLYGDTYYLPYAAGMLAAYAFDDPLIQSNYHLGRLIYSHEAVEDALDSFEDPFLVGFSNSLWNYDYNISFAEQLKKRWPDCIVLFGGHQITPDTACLKTYDFIDVLIHGKGEEAFREVLKAYACSGGIEGIANISFRANDGRLIKNQTAKIKNTHYPSPYLTGVFDDLLKESSFAFSCILETNRGCPYGCAFCDWGEIKSEVRLFPMDKIHKEIEWIADHKMEFCYCVDANFGMFVRDETIANWLAEMKSVRGYPKKLQVSYGKANPERVFRINSILSAVKLNKGVSLSLQSLSPAVLKNIGRENMDLAQYQKQLSLFHKANIPTWTEMIIALPGETYTSFCEGMCLLLEYGQHKSVTVYCCELLPNAEMSTPEFIKEYSLQTISTTLNKYHCEDMSAISTGHSSIVVETNTMSRVDWVKAYLFSLCLQVFHHFGLLQCFAVYLHDENEVSYFQFYNDLFEWIFSESLICKSIFLDMESRLNAFVRGEGGLTYQKEIFGKITWPFEEAIFLLLAEQITGLYNELIPFLNRFKIHESVYNDLLVYQKSIIVLPFRDHFSITLEHDLYPYFFHALSNEKVAMEKRKNTVSFTLNCGYPSWEDYAREVVWFGRRNGKMLYINDPDSVQVHYFDG